MQTFRLILYCLLFSLGTPLFAAPPNPWQDARLLGWSAEINAGQYAKVIAEVEQDLVSSSPHPFDVDIWCRLQLRQGTLDSAVTAITDPALKAALGVAPKLYLLDDQGKTGEVMRLGKSLSPEQIRGSFTYRVLISNAVTATENDQAYDWTMTALRTQDPNFILIWLAANIQEHDLRIRNRMLAMLAQDSAFSATPAGRGLASMLAIADIHGSNLNCSNRQPEGHAAFVALAKAWLVAYPGDSGALTFQADHEVDLNADPDSALKTLNQALDGYPLLRIGSARDAVSKAEFGRRLNAGDPAALALNTRWANLAWSSPTKAKASAASTASSSLRVLSGCGLAARLATAFDLVQSTLDATPEPDRGGLYAEMAEIELTDDADPAAPQRAIDNARKALLTMHDEYYQTLRIRALSRTKADPDTAEAMQLYNSALTALPDHSETFYSAGDTLLDRTATCQQREQNWQTAQKEFPRADWAVFGIAQAQEQCGQPQDAMESMRTLFGIVRPGTYHIMELQRLWAELGNSADISAQRTAFLRANPTGFQGVTEPAFPQFTRPAVPADGHQLNLVPQTPPTKSLRAMAVNLDGTLAATADANGVVKLWGMEAPRHEKGLPPTPVCTSIVDPTCPRLLRNISPQTGDIAQLQFSPDSQWLLVSGANGLLSGFRVLNGQLAWTLNIPVGGFRFAVQPAVAGSPGRMAVLVRKPDPPVGDQVSSGRGWSMLLLCSIAADAPCKTLSWYSNWAFTADAANQLAWSADGRSLAMRVSDAETLILDADSLKLLGHPQTPAGAIFDASLSAVLVHDDSALKYQTLQPNAKPVQLTAIHGELLDAQALPGQRIRYAVLEPEPPPATDDDAPKQPKPAVRKISVFELASPEPGTPVQIASLPAADYPVPALLLAGDRLTIFSRLVATPGEQGPNSRRTSLLAVALAYYTPGNPQTLTLQRIGSEPRTIPNSVAFSANDRELLVGRGESGATHVDLWDLSDLGQPIQPKTDPFVGSRIALNGSTLITCAGTSGEGFIRQYDLLGREVPATARQNCALGLPVFSLADSSGVAWATPSNDALTVQPSIGPAWNTASITSGDLITAAAGTSNLLLATTALNLYSVDKTGHVTELCTDACPSHANFSALAITGDAHYAVAAIGPTNSASVPAPSAEYGILVVDLQAGTMRLQKDIPGDLQIPVTSVAFVPGSTRYIAGTVDGRLLLGDAAQPADLQPFSQEDSSVAAIGYSQDGRFLAAALTSGSVFLWNLTPDTRRLAQLDTFADGDWSVVSPNGQYDAAHAGRLDELFWVYGNSTIQLDQMLNAYYRSRLLPRLVGFETAALQQSPPLDASALPPRITVTPDPATGQDVSPSGEIVFSVDRPMNQVGEISVYVNGSPVSTASQRVTADGLVHVSLASHHTYAPGELNRITIVASNRDSSITSRGLEVSEQASGVAEQQPQQFYAIIAGVSQYAGDLGPLPLADADAREMARDVARGASQMVGDPSRVHIILLSNDSKAGQQTQNDLKNFGSVQWMDPTHADFVKAFAEFKALPRKDDIFLLFFAGHGLPLGANGDYVFPTREFASSKSPVAGTYLTSEDLLQELKDIGAPHTILLFDTCNSGAVLGKLASGNSSASGESSIDMENQALETLRNTLSPKSAPYMLMGAGANESAYDLPLLGHGFLTAGLMLSMHMQIKGDDLYADQWLTGARSTTQDIAQRYGYRQNPPETLQGDRLKVAVLPPQQLACIPSVDAVPPLITLPDFEDTSTQADRLNLKRNLAALLRAQLKPNDPVPPYLYQDSSDTDSIAVKVHYAFADGHLTATIIYRYGTKNTYSQPDTVLTIPFSDNPTDLQKDNFAQMVLAHIDSYATYVWSQKRGEGNTVPKACSELSTAMSPAQ